MLRELCAGLGVDPDPVARPSGRVPSAGVDPLPRVARTRGGARPSRVVTIWIRDARPSEAAALTELCLRSKASWGYDAEFMRQCQEVLRVSPERISTWQLRVASDASGELLGVSGHSVAPRVSGLAAELELMFVEPGAMRRGVGRALFADVVARLRERRVSVLWILSDPGAEPFYLAQGAVRAGMHVSDAVRGRWLPWLRFAVDTSVPTLVTERLRLRPWCPADRAAFAEINADPYVSRYLPAPLTAAESAALTERIADGFARYGFGFWAVERTDQSAAPFIGFTGLSVPGFQAAFTPCVEIGWRLATPHWGQGLATEAARAVLSHAFETLELEELVAFTAARNFASRRVMEKLNMRHRASEDFAHPSLPLEHPLSRHVLYRASRDRGAQ